MYDFNFCLTLIEIVLQTSLLCVYKGASELYPISVLIDTFYHLIEK